MMKKVLLACSVLVLASCATYKPIPDNYKGPIATVADSGEPESASKGRVFALTKIDGNPVMDSFEATRQRSYGRGALVTLEITERQMPARPMQVTLRGAHVTGAPIHELASRAMGTFFEVEGVVEFKPEADKRYKVVGKLSKDLSEVWIADESTNQPVTAKVSTVREK